MTALFEHRANINPGCLDRRALGRRPHQSRYLTLSERIRKTA